MNKHRNQHRNKDKNKKNINENKHKNNKENAYPIFSISKRKILKNIRQQFIFASMLIQKLVTANYLKDFQNKLSQGPIIDSITFLNKKEINIKKSNLGIYQEIENPVILVGQTCLLLKNNYRLIRQVHSFLWGNLKGSCTAAGFKKVLYNRITVINRQLKPGYNRRKHNHSHSIIITNQLRRIDKAFRYVGRNKLLSIIALALGVGYKLKAEEQTNTIFSNNQLPSFRTIPNLVSTIETQEALLLWRNQFRYSVDSCRQALLHRNLNQNIDIFCKDNTAVMLKEWVR